MGISNHNIKLVHFLSSRFPTTSFIPPPPYRACQIYNRPPVFQSPLPYALCKQPFTNWVPKGVVEQLLRRPPKHTAFFRVILGKVSCHVSSRHKSTASSTFAPINHSANTAVASKYLVDKGDAARKNVAWWLFGCSAWVFSMVILGGMTRLTRSGLSMTDWKFTGSFPPMSKKEWETEFEMYKQSPEYKRVNNGMTLDGFKFIYWMEYGHRMWGRGLGLFFAGPFTYFLCKGFITWRLGLRLSAFLAMGAGQGFVGWWMVKSGLEEPKSEYAQPRVSPYRLAAHLISAFAIYSGLYWTALTVLFPEPPKGNMNWVKGSAKLRRIALPVAAFVGLTAMSGAFVAGNDAGHAFNTFPKMGDYWIPENLFEMQPVIRNFFENTATVQFDHRILAIMTMVGIGGLWLAAQRLPLNPSIKLLADSAFGMSILQVTLGISTLLSYVPVSLGVAHQAGALTLFTLMISLLHMLRRSPMRAVKVPARTLQIIR